MSKRYNYKPLPSLSELNPGVEPVEFNVLVLVSELEDKSSGGVILVDDAKDREELSGIEGLLVAVSPMAFAFDEWPNGARKPQAGDRVTFTKWAGVVTMGDDGRRYRLMKDKDITGVRRAQPAQSAVKAA